MDREGFQCPDCATWVRVRVNNNGQAWLQRGRRMDGRFEPAPLPPRSVRQPEAGSLESFPDVSEMDLPTVQEQLREAETRLSALEAELQRLMVLRTRPGQDEQTRLGLNRDINRLTRRQIEWQSFAQRLRQRQSDVLQQERDRAQQAAAASSSNGGLMVFLGAALSCGGIFFFTRLINLHLDSHAMTVALIIALISGGLTWVIAQMR